MAHRFFVALVCLFGMIHAPARPEVEGGKLEYKFICENEGSGPSAVDVLRATGIHNTFLELLSRYDPQAFTILSDPQLADKTVWAPADAAFKAIEESLSSMSDEAIKSILGYHISPPRRTPWGSYPLVTPQFLFDAGRMNHRTRTGVLTGSDQRIDSSVVDGFLMIEDAIIMDTAWCTEAGSVFSLESVIMSVAKPSVAERMFNRTIRILFYDDIRFFIYSTVFATTVGLFISHVVGKRLKQKENNKMKVSF